MKNLLLFLAFAFLAPIVASANNYIYSARQSEDDPCCIIIVARVTDEAYAGTLIVEIDGVPTYTDLDASGVMNIEHCFEGNGSHDVDFYVGEVLYGSYTFDITDCEGACTICEFTTLIPLIDQVNDCNFIVDYRWITVNDIKGYSPECVNPTVFWDFGDGTTSDDTPLTNGYFHDYPADGTYTACITFTVTNPDGFECTVRECIDVVVTGCDPDPDPCCGLDIGELDFRVFGSGCLTWIRPVGASVDRECGDVDYAWTVDGTPTISYGENLLVTFDGPGPFEVCLTMTQGDCDVSDCVTVDLPDCEEGLGGGSGDGTTRFGVLDLMDFTEVSIAPNPATDWINVSISENPFSDSEVITILDTNGKVIQSANAQANAITSMDVSGLPMGIYFVQVSNELGMISTERFVKTK